MGETEEICASSCVEEYFVKAEGWLICQYVLKLMCDICCVS